MPTITDIQIQKNNKTRANVYLDGEFAFGLEMVTVMKLGLKIGKQVSADIITDAVFDSEVSVAFGKAVDYLARGLKTTKQMRDYLTKKGYAPNVVDCVIDKLTSYHYLDDQNYATLYTQQNVKTKGERRIKQELSQRGIDREQVDKINVDDQTELQNAMALASKYLKNKPCDQKTMVKLQRYLLYRGYGFDIVNQVIRHFANFDNSDICD